MQVPEVETVFTCTGQGEDITQQGAASPSCRSS